MDPRSLPQVNAVNSSSSYNNSYIRPIKSKFKLNTFAKRGISSHGLINLASYFYSIQTKKAIEVQDVDQFLSLHNQKKNTVVLRNTHTNDTRIRIRIIYVCMCIFFPARWTILHCNFSTFHYREDKLYVYVQGRWKNMIVPFYIYGQVNSNN